MSRPAWRGKQGSSLFLEGVDGEKLKNTKNEPDFPREKYPPLKTPYLPRPEKHNEYRIMLMQNYLDYFQDSKFYVELPEKNVNKVGVEKKALDLEWEAFPRELWPKEYKDKWVKDHGEKAKRKQTKRARQPLKSVGESLEKRLKSLDALEEKEEDDEKNTSLEQQEKEEEEEEFNNNSEEDEEMDEGTDYQTNYYDEGEDYPADDDDALSDGDTY